MAAANFLRCSGAEVMLRVGRRRPKGAPQSDGDAAEGAIERRLQRLSVDNKDQTRWEVSDKEDVSVDGEGHVERLKARWEPVVGEDKTIIVSWEGNQCTK